MLVTSTFIRVGYPGVQSNWDNSFFVVSRRPRDTSYGHRNARRNDETLGTHDECHWIMPRLGGESPVEKKVPEMSEDVYVCLPRFISEAW